MTEHLRRHKRGLLAEIAAGVFLVLKFWRLRAWRHKTRYGEIDLIATKGKTIAFIEVKARANYETGVEAVSPVAQARIMAAAQSFMARHPCYAHYDWRFDVVVVTPRRLPYHIKDAWRA